MAIDIHHHQGVCILTLQRPAQRQALDVPTLHQLLQSLKDAQERDDVRAVLLQSSGVSFCAGADLKEWAQVEAEGRLETYGWTEAAHELMALLYAFPKPTVVAIQGAAVGAGVDLALCCDLRIAARSATFKAGYTQMAYSPDAGASWHLPRLIGPEAARRYLFLDEKWSAEQAFQAGMIGELCEDADLTDRAHAVALRLAQGPTLAYAQTKALLLASPQNDLPSQLAAERLAGLICGRSQDGAEALAASIERRKPVFTGK